MHRPFAFALVLLAACGGKQQDTPPSGVTFAPHEADTVIRLDLARARAWTGWAKAAPVAFGAVQPAIDAVKRACDIDLLGEASSMLLARRGVGTAADMTLVIGGVTKDKTAGCAVKLGSSLPGVQLVPDGDRFQVVRDGKAFASGAILASGEVVISSRGGAAIDPGAWRAQVTGEPVAPPSWWAELDQKQPLALWMKTRPDTYEHTITANVELGDPFVIHAKIVEIGRREAELEQARLKAIVEFLQKAEAGTGRLELQDNVVFGDFTATGPQIDRLVAAGLSAIRADQAPATEPPPVGDTSPIDCTELRPAVEKYLATSMEKMAADQRTAIAATIVKLQQALGDAYVDSCKTETWPPGAIHCHVDNAGAISKFEKCRLLVPEDARKKFDERVKTALQSSAAP